MGGYGEYFFNWFKRRDPRPYNSFGNGSAMRVSPIGWLFGCENEVRKQAELSAAITHNHPEGIKGAVAAATAIFRMRTEKIKSPSIFEQVAKEFYGSDAFLNLPRRGVFDGSCQSCVPLALHLASLATSFEDAVRLAVSYGGDSDTMGAIVGSLAEAQYEIPLGMTSRAKSYLSKDMLEVVEQFEKSKK